MKKQIVSNTEIPTAPKHFEQERKGVSGEIKKGATLLAGASNSAPLFAEFFGYFLVQRQESTTPPAATNCEQDAPMRKRKHHASCGTDLQKECTHANRQMFPFYPVCVENLRLYTLKNRTAMQSDFHVRFDL